MPSSNRGGPSWRPFEFSKAQRLVKLGHISIDGTKIKANASNNHTITKEELELVKRLIMKGIDVDIEENELYGDERGDQLPPGTTRKKMIREKLEELQKKGENEAKLKKNTGVKIVEQYINGALEDKKRKSRIKS